MPWFTMLCRTFKALYTIVENSEAQGLPSYFDPDVDLNTGRLLVLGESKSKASAGFCRRAGTKTSNRITRPVG